jgi:hypothetical protein
LKFTPEGGCSSLSGDDSQVVLTGVDTGVGIPQDEQAQIFGVPPGLSMVITNRVRASARCR